MTPGEAVEVLPLLRGAALDHVAVAVRDPEPFGRPGGERGEGDRVNGAQSPLPGSPLARNELRASGTEHRRVWVGVQAPEVIAPKIAYVLEQLLIAARIPHRVERVEHGRPSGKVAEWDLFYGDAPPAVSQGGASGTGLLAVSRTRPAATTRTMRASPTAATQAP